MDPHQEEECYTSLTCHASTIPDLCRFVIKWDFLSGFIYQDFRASDNFAAFCVRGQEKGGGKAPAEAPGLKERSKGSYKIGGCNKCVSVLVN